MMDEKKLHEHITNLKRALDKKEPASTIVSILKALRKEDAPSEEVLRVSLISCWKRYWTMANPMPISGRVTPNHKDFQVARCIPRRKERGITTRLRQ